MTIGLLSQLWVHTSDHLFDQYLQATTATTSATAQARLVAKMLDPVTVNCLCTKASNLSKSFFLIQVQTRQR